MSMHTKSLSAFFFRTAAEFTLASFISTGLWFQLNQHTLNSGLHQCNLPLLNISYIYLKSELTPPLRDIKNFSSLPETKALFVTPSSDVQRKTMGTLTRIVKKRLRSRLSLQVMNEKCFFFHLQQKAIKQVGLRLSGKTHR